MAFDPPDRHLPRSLRAVARRLRRLVEAEENAEAFERIDAAIRAALFPHDHDKKPPDDFLHPGQQPPPPDVEPEFRPPDLGR